MQDVNEIIKCNIGLVYSQLNKLYLNNDDNAISIGYEALYTAILTFDESKGFAFSTYATCCIYNALGSYIRTLKRKNTLDIISYNNFVQDKNGNKHEYCESLTSRDDSVEHKILKEEYVTNVMDSFNYVYCNLVSDKQKLIVKIWRDNDFNITNEEIAETAKVSQPYVNQVLNTIRNRIKKRMEAVYD